MPEAAERTLAGGRVRVRGAEDGELEAMAREYGLALTTGELRRIADRLGRDPTLVEAHAFDAQWSEHCSYKSSRGLLRRLPIDGPAVILGPKEDAGIVRLGEWQGESYGIVIAHESHNHPSQVVPFEGAATGIGGIVRDVLCMGAQVIAVADPLRFGPLDDPHCRYIAQSVVDGIAAYGNAIGVPNIAGDVFFHPGFRENVLVNVVALGLVKEDEVIHSAAPPDSAGWDIVLVGKATDRSGFGGAAFSSLVLDGAGADANKSAVQVPDPFLKSVLMRASYRAFAAIRERQLTVAFKDLGAGGIMGCTAELVASGGFGATIDLDRCPTAQRLPPAVIAIGETQERLAWIVPPTFTPVLLAIYNDEFALPQIAQGACAAVVGRVAPGNAYVMRWRGEEVLRLPVDFLTAGISYERSYEPELTEAPAALVPPMRDTLMPPVDVITALPRVLAHHDVCSRAAIFERYDSVVRGTTAIPAGFADAGVIVPIPQAPLGVALGVGGNPRYAVCGSHRTAELAVAEAVCNVVAVGARPIGLTDCLNFGNPQDPRVMGQFVAAVDGLAHAATELGVPFVSGNVSLYNQSTSGRAIPASPIVACIGAIDDISLVGSRGLRRVGSRLVLLGRPQAALGGSVLAECYGADERELPSIDYGKLRAAIEVVTRGLRDGVILSVHDVSSGGLLTALTKMAFDTIGGEPIGARIDLSELQCALGSIDSNALLFAEYPGFVVEVAPDVSLAVPADDVRDDGGEAPRGPMSTALGWTLPQPVLEIWCGSELRAQLTLAELHAAWCAPLQRFYDGVAS